MRAETDPVSGAARLDDDAHDAVLRAAAGSAEAALADALPAGVLDVVRSPVVTWRLVVAGREARLEHRAWVGAATSTLLLGVREGTHQLMASDPAFLTAALVRLTRLRPRRVGDREPVTVPADRLEDALAADPGRRSDALAELGAGHGWRLEIGWAGGRREVTAVDGEAGVQLAQTSTTEPGTAVLVPVSNTTVYRILATALPSEALAG